VALDEVQTALAWHPKVAAVGVAAISDELKAYVVPAAGVSGDVTLARELQSFVAGRRATHEVPRRIEFVKALPSDENGAVVREELSHMPIRLDAPTPDERW
jgi:acetyl-CoA synthetase